MTSILCLAHFCEVHGPTPLMVTEGLPVKCAFCDDRDDVPDLMAAVAKAVSSAPTPAPSSSSFNPHDAMAAATAATTAALRKASLSPSPRRDSSPRAVSQEAMPRDASRTAAAAAAAAAAKPRSSRPQSGAPAARSPQLDPATSNFRKTYDDAVTKRAIPCDNCAMTLPPRKTDNSGSSRSSAGAGAGAPATDTRNPTLRTRVPCARVYDGLPEAGSPRLLQPSPSTSSTSSDTEGDDDRLYGRNHRHRHPHDHQDGHSRRDHHDHQHHLRRTGTATSVATSRSSTSSASRPLRSHTHYLDYTSTHEPVSANAYCIIRASCLRTLTLETLPRSPASATTSAGGGGSPFLPAQSSAFMPSPWTSIPTTPYFSSPHAAANASTAAAAAANGGPLFFGDPAAGYTTAHVFRVADMHARGHKRVYALIALNTHRERLAMKAFGFVSAAFNDLAIWIQQLAEAEADRVAMLHAESTAASSPAASASAGDGSPSTSTTNPSFVLDRPTPSPHVSQPPTQPSSLANEGGSSFLVAAGHGLSRRMGPGFAGFGGLGSSAAASLRARGLPEILGMPDFFIELHARFVRLLLELGIALNQ